jgi:hypothetical protein
MMSLELVVSISAERDLSSTFDLCTILTVKTVVFDNTQCCHDL